MVFREVSDRVVRMINIVGFVRLFWVVYGPMVRVVKVRTRVQAENKKKSSGTFLKLFDPRINLVPFFRPPGFVFTYLIGLSNSPPQGQINPF